MKINQQQMASVLDRLEIVHGYRLDHVKLPIVFKDRFYRSIDVFSKCEIDYARMGYAEEIGDLTYQLVKMSAVSAGILTQEYQKLLYLRYKDIVDKKSNKISIRALYKSAFVIIEKLDDKQIPGILARNSFAYPEKTAKNFIANQYVSYISRKYRNPDDTNAGFQTAEYIKSNQIPEETAEIIDILSCPSRKLRGRELLTDMMHNLELSAKLVSLVDRVVNNDCNVNMIYTFLDSLKKEKLGPGLTLDELLEFSLFKIRGRQELTFKGYAEEQVKHLCKPAEYIMEAYLITGR